VTGLRMHPFIVTLGTMSIFRGIGNVWITIKTLPAPGRAAAVVHRRLHDVRAAAAVGRHRGFSRCRSWSRWLRVGGAIYLGLTVAGRENYAVGGNEEAARFSGLPVERIKLRVYA
jgi:ribose/xylose/arabinose/galactoside ABC-type transport system permease subunit